MNRHPSGAGEQPIPYSHFGSYLRERYEVRVHKVTIDAGFTCPNRDGTKGVGGCIYCNNEGFSAHSRPSRAGLSVARQVETGIEWARRRYKARKFIAYFQAYTNTYAPLLTLKGLYDQVLDFPDVIGLDIGTRPDCVSPEIIDLVAGYTETLDEVWMEYGLQSSHDRTLQRINRGHDYQCFLDAVDATMGRGIKICVHVILGLPGESREDMLVTADRLASVPIDGIKIHLLHLLRDTPIVSLHERGELELLGRGEYVSLVCDYLERLPKHVLVHRLTGEAPPETLIAPRWCLDKGGVLRDIKTEMRRRGVGQGSKLEVCHGASLTS